MRHEAIRRIIAGCPLVPEKLIWTWLAVSSHLPMQYHLSTSSGWKSRIKLYKASFEICWQANTEHSCRHCLGSASSGDRQSPLSPGLPSQHFVGALRKDGIPPLHQRQPKALTTGNGIMGGTWERVSGNTFPEQVNMNVPCLPEWMVKPCHRDSAHLCY